MLIFSKRARDFLQKYLPEALEAEKLNDALDLLYDLIMDKGFITWEDGYNDFGREAQAVYDDLFDDNCKPRG